VCSSSKRSHSIWARVSASVTRIKPDEVKQAHIKKVVIPQRIRGWCRRILIAYPLFRYVSDTERGEKLNTHIQNIADYNKAITTIR
jgi:hypothetical protein